MSLRVRLRNSIDQRDLQCAHDCGSESKRRRKFRRTWKNDKNVPNRRTSKRINFPKRRMLIITGKCPCQGRRNQRVFNYKFDSLCHCTVITRAHVVQYVCHARDYESNCNHGLTHKSKSQHKS